MARYVIKYRNYAAHFLDQPVVQEVLVNGSARGAWRLSVPSVALDRRSNRRWSTSLRAVLDVVAAAVSERPDDAGLYPTAMYRHTAATMISHDIYLPITDASQIRKEVLVDGRPFPVAAVYANSQKICEKIRNVSAAQGIGFIDTRPTFRAAGAQRPLHGPRDWNHLNESGYRVLGTYLAARIEMSSDDLCNDQWGAEDRLVPLAKRRSRSDFLPSSNSGI